jgi:hypothetical protein
MSQKLSIGSSKTGCPFPFLQYSVVCAPLYRWWSRGTGAADRAANGIPMPAEKDAELYNMNHRYTSFLMLSVTGIDIFSVTV